MADLNGRPLNVGDPVMVAFVAADGELLPLLQGTILQVLNGDIYRVQPDPPESQRKALEEAASERSAEETPEEKAGTDEYLAEWRRALDKIMAAGGDAFQNPMTVPGWRLTKMSGE